jgi:kynurenine formamidase
MCAPFVMEDVRAAVSRRGFIAAVTACAAIGTPGVAAQQKPVRLPKGFRDVIDLTHPFSPALPVYPGYKPIQIRQRFSVARDGFAANEVTFDEHTGTHLDAPSHFIVGAASADRLPVGQLIAPLAVIGIAARAAKDPDTVVTVDDLLAWEKRHGRLPSGAVVAMDSGWDARAGNQKEFLNQDAKGALHMPGFGEEAARFLVEQRDIAGVAVDTLSLDAGVAQKFVAHLAILGAGKYGLELMANLGRIPPSGATVFIGAMKHDGATGGPARVVAVV